VLERVVKACGKNIYCKIADEHLLERDVPVIVFLHEGLGTSEQWKDFPSEIAASFNMPVVMYDRYGYGKSEEIQGQRTMNYMEDEARLFLPEILKELGISNKKLILLGHSDGGSIAAFFATFFPQNVLAAIIEAPHFFIEDISVQGITAAVHAYEHGSLKKKLEKYHGSKTESMFRSWTGILLTEHMRSWNTEHILSGIQCPVLAIQGTDDDFGTLKQIETIRTHARGEVELLVIEGCGHIPHHQARDIVAKAACDFLEKVFP
jgi:pimeloyl-ACP methyl ester carboxylesterase